MRCTKLTRFIYLTDTHIGANPIGYHQQPAYPERTSELLSILEKEIVTHDIDFVVHGGDLIDSCNPDIIKQANTIFTLPVPVYLCLGNHDLDNKDALEIWLENTPNLFKGNDPCFEIINNDSIIHIIPNHWEKGFEYYWKGDQKPYLSDYQINRIEQTILKYPNKIHILVTHSTVFGMKPEQSGLLEVTHEAPDSFKDQIANLTERYDNLKLVLSGHSHINTIRSLPTCTFVTGSSFVETPFEYKLIDVTELYLNVSTQQIDITDLKGINPMYDEERSYVQGREIDRNVMLNF